MSRRRIAGTLLATLVAGTSGAALAVRSADRMSAVPAGGTSRLVASRSGLEAVGERTRLRAQAAIRWSKAPQRAVGAWSRLVADSGVTDWQASWDEATGVPSRIFGRGVAAPRTSRDAAAAERHARAFLTRHVDLLAPGAAASDFVMVSNVAQRGMRVVGFRQTHAGMTVLGGQVSFRYKNDRLFVIGSEALPHVQVAAAPGLVADTEATRGFARSWVLADAATTADTGSVTGPFVLPLVGDGGVIGYRVVNRVDVTARGPVGRYWVYTDSATGAPVAREQRLRFADGLVRFNVPVRYPARERQSYPAKSGIFTIDGGPVQSTDAGQVTWAGTQAGDLVLRATGPLVRVSNQSGANATRNFVIQPGGTVTWTESGDELLDAQLNAFIHAGVVKDYAREHLNPDLGWLGTQLPVNVNIADECNAFSDGNSINFFQSSEQCGNTGQLADVVYHEFGHSLHANSLIDGVGAFDGAHSEGLSDFLAATITGDPGMGRGFFLNDDPLRHIDPPDYENSWPRDVAEIHFTGLIFAGAMWDLRKIMIAQYGEEAGIALANRLFYATLQRATNIPATYVEILAEDDDDGDLSNGTPNVCDINSAFGAHGLRALQAKITPLAAEVPGEAGFPISLAVSGLYPQCPGDGLAGAKVDWLVRGQGSDNAQIIDMEEADDGTWSATIPPVDPGQVVRFKLAVEFLDGTTRVFPDNLADPRYEFYSGEVEPIYCTDFESDPFADGWTHALTSGMDEPGADDWSWGVPMSSGSSGDPTAAFSGAAVIGNDLGSDGGIGGSYLPNKTNHAMTPLIDVGRYSDVRLQYWRWLTVEDAFFDKATVYANGDVAWRNFDSEQGEQSATQHLDREWRFQDVPVSEFISQSMLQVKFEIASDGGLEFGGWTVDDFCVVAAVGAVCGDGNVTGAETCDEGTNNSDTDADACRTNCRIATCGDGVVDSSEACDDGNTVDGDTCNATCAVGDDEGGDCGCEVAPRQPGPGTGSLLLLALAALLLLAPRAWRRRRDRPPHM